jgi:hypothetical protein
VLERFTESAGRGEVRDGYERAQVRRVANTGISANPEARGNLVWEVLEGSAVCKPSAPSLNANLMEGMIRLAAHAGARQSCTGHEPPRQLPAGNTPLPSAPMSGDT